MAVLKGPCFSLRARGSLGSTIVYTGNRKTHVVKRQNSRTNPNTIPQRSHRSMLRYLATAWNISIPPSLASWVNNTPPEAASPFHFYMQDGMAHWRIGQAPTWWYGLWGGSTTPAINTWTIKPQGNHVRLAIGGAGRVFLKGVIWHRGLSAGFTVSPSTAIDVQTINDVDNNMVVDVLHSPDEYFYKLQIFNPYGKMVLDPNAKSIVYP
jgi:hypothetical protein